MVQKSDNEILRKMKTAKQIREELENEYGWNFSSEENMEMYYDLFMDVQKIALRQPLVSGQVCKHKHIMHINSEIGWLCLECRKFSDDKQVFH